MLSKTTSKPRMRLLALPLLLFVSGCQSGSPVDSFCLVSEPIRPTQAQFNAMSDAEARRTLAHNEFGAKRCGWEP